MVQRRYGPVRGAGVGVIEEDGGKSIEPGALGWACYAGVLERGPEGEMIEAQNSKAYAAKCGGIIDDSLLPDCCLDYYKLANGAGGLLLRRILDGNQAPGSKTVYGRYGDLLTPMGTISAHNGGRWSGKKDKTINAATGKTDTTITTGVATWKTDQWKGATITHPEITNKTYTVVGNTDAGIITLEADSTYLADWTAASATHEYFYMSLENETKSLSYLIGDGEEKPDTEFSLSFFIDGAFWKKYPNLSTNPTDARYWINIINNDTSNFVVTVADLWTGGHTAAVRPANHYGKIATVTATVLTAVINDFTINSPVGAGNPTFALGTTDDLQIAQKLTITMVDPTTGNVVSDKFGALGLMTLGSEFNPPANTGGTTNVNKWVPPFTVTAGVTPLVALDTLVINYKPLVADSLIGGRVYPDKPNAKRTFFRIVDNDHKTITAADGSDMTVDGATDDYFLVEAPLELEGGRDGIADLVDADYNQQAWDTGTSVFNRVINRNMGLLKCATPGVTSTSVQKAGVAYADAKNHQYRYEAPANVLTESAAIELVNDTLGRSDFAVISFPSYSYVTDPNDTGEGRLKLVSSTGMIHGAEAAVAKAYGGYHKAEAGIDVKLPAILKLPSGETVFDEEQLNPVGIGVIKKIKGNFVLWGDRMLHLDPNWKWKHQREQMSYYEHVLQENFDWIVYAINDAIERPKAITALLGFFLPEWAEKRAIRGTTLQDAVIIKIDSENNTDATMAAGDMWAEIKPRLADTVERFIMKIGKQGIFESVG